jgi:hypothetical protein
MFRAEFEAIWSAEKSIVQDVVFELSRGYTDVYSVDNIEVIGIGGLFANMSYDCRSAALSCNFTLKGVGAIHRYCMGGTSHGDCGRFHEHYIHHGDCVRRQLPNVVRRDDLTKKGTEELWRTVCQEANITFTGEFYAPEAQCI